MVNEDRGQYTEGPPSTRHIVVFLGLSTKFIRPLPLCGPSPLTLDLSQSHQWELNFKTLHNPVLQYLFHPIVEWIHEKAIIAR